MHSLDVNIGQAASGSVSSGTEVDINAGILEELEHLGLQAASGQRNAQRVGGLERMYIV